MSKNSEVKISIALYAAFLVNLIQLGTPVKTIDKALFLSSGYRLKDFDVHAYGITREDRKVIKDAIANG